MVIQLPKEIEDRLNDLADREGKPAVQLAVDAINAAYPDPLRPRAWPTSIGAGGDAGVDSSQLDVWGDEDPPWAGLIGMFPDGGVTVAEFDEWLKAARASDERLARKTSIKR